MKILSAAFAHNNLIPAKYTCDGKNINPPLEFQDIPSEAKTLALVVDDPDAPAGPWVHWQVFNIPPDCAGIGENEKFEQAVEGMTSFGAPGYGGPCPPNGTHRYFFKLYALDTKLALDSRHDKKALTNAIIGHILAHAELIGLYKR